MQRLKSFQFRLVLKRGNVDELYINEYNSGYIFGPIAQLGARLNGIEKAEGSNPSGSTEKVLAGVLNHPPASRESEVRARQGAQGAQSVLGPGLNSPAVPKIRDRLRR
jgi:hypothetical protein